MVLLPSADAQDTRPQYYITVNMNVFMPLSHITTIYRGATEYGEVVGEFEYVLSVLNYLLEIHWLKKRPQNGHYNCSHYAAI